MPVHQVVSPYEAFSVIEGTDDPSAIVVVHDGGIDPLSFARIVRSSGAQAPIYVVGHTDATGKFDANMTLSRQRAEAVVEALTEQYAIEAGRLSAHGVGPLSPKSTNRTDPGKGENRRVELVER